MYSNIFKSILRSVTFTGVRYKYVLHIIYTQMIVDCKLLYLPEHDNGLSNTPSLQRHLSKSQNVWTPAHCEAMVTWQLQSAPPYPSWHIHAPVLTSHPVLVFLSQLQLCEQSLEYIHLGHSTRKAKGSLHD